MAEQKSVLQWNVQGSRGAVIIPLSLQSDGKYKETENNRYFFDLIGDNTEMKIPGKTGSSESGQYIEFKSSTNTTFKIPITAVTKTLQQDGKFKVETGSGGDPVFAEVNIHIGNTPLSGAEKTRVSLPAWLKAKINMQKSPVLVGFDMGKLVGDTGGHSTGWLIGNVGEVGFKPKNSNDEVLSFKGTPVQLAEMTLGTISFKNADDETVSLHAPTDLSVVAGGDFDVIEGA